MDEKRSELVYLEDILDAVRKIMAYLSDTSKSEFYANTEKQDAVLRRLEIIGEASKKISNALRLRYADVPWRQMAGMRDVVIHEYYGVSLDLIWNVAKKEIPPLQAKIEQIIEDLQ